MTVPHLPIQMPGPDYGADQGGYPAVKKLATGPELLAAALEIVRLGGFVLPCAYGAKKPIPLHGLKEAASSEEWVRYWWDGKKMFNIAETTGTPGRYDVLDVDNHGERGNGWEAFNRLKAAGLVAGAVKMVRTPSGGAHVCFSASRQRSGSLPKHHLDFKAQGGYVLVPPSQVGGRLYEVVDQRPPTGATLDWEACKRLLQPRRAPAVSPNQARSRPRKIGHLPDLIAREGTGNRNKLLYWAAMRAAEAGDEQVLIELVGAAVQAGLPEAEAYRTVASAARRVEHGG